MGSSTGLMSAECQSWRMTEVRCRSRIICGFGGCILPESACVYNSYHGVKGQDKDLFGGDARSVSRIITFADEIKPEADKPWAYVAIVSVPVNRCKEALNRLLTDKAEYDNGETPMGEIGWKHVRNPDKCQIARKWLHRVATEHDLWRFTVLGIDTSKLVMNAFGEGLGYQRYNVYKRFYRSCLAYHVSSLSRQHDSVEVVRCYHDTEGRLEQDEWFKWHAQARITNEKANVNFGCREVTFVHSDHRREEKNPSASHFIQLCDVLAGASRYVLELHNRSANRDIACQPLVPLLERINCPERSLITNSSYRHVGRASISYFPSRPLEEHELEDPFARGLSTFYKGRKLMFLERDQGGFDF